jgi:hypothetical protein
MTHNNQPPIRKPLPDFFCIAILLIAGGNRLSEFLRNGGIWGLLDADWINLVLMILVLGTGLTYLWRLCNR